MKNLIINIYCTRDRNTKACPLHESYKDGYATHSTILACVNCPICEIEITSAGKSLMVRGLPRNLDGMNLSNYEE